MMFLACVQWVSKMMAIWFSCWVKTKASLVVVNTCKCNTGWQEENHLLLIWKGKKHCKNWFVSSSERGYSNLPRYSEGGLAIALVECALCGERGVEVDLTTSQRPDIALFSESQGRAVVSISSNNLDAVLTAAEKYGVPATVLGTVAGELAHNSEWRSSR